MLLKTYWALSNRFPDACPHLFGGRIEGTEALWLSLDSQGHPHLLFEASVDEGQPDLKLKSVEVRFACPCDIQLQDGSVLSGTFTLVSLRDDDPDIVRVFLRLLEETLLAPGARHTSADIREQMLAIADLFAPLEDDVHDVLGLWGELHIIRSASDVAAAVRAWSSSSRARYDFIAERYAIEVKTTLKPRREHRFSLEQLRPETDIEVYVVSVLLIELLGGEYVHELVDQISRNLSDANVRASFFRQCLRKGGIDLYGSELRLAELPGGLSTAVFEARVLPVPSVAGDRPISRVRFDLDLSAQSHLSGPESRRLLSFAGSPHWLSDAT
jgi:hypothetical protein